MKKAIILIALLFVTGCGTSYNPSTFWQDYTRRENAARLDRLENTAREHRIGLMFPNIASKPGY